MRVEKLNDNKVNDFIDYCKKHREEVDDTFLYDADLEKFNVNEGNITYVLMDENCDDIIGAVSVITNLNYLEERKSRFRIFHSKAANIEAYDMMLKSLLNDIEDTDRIFIFANGKDEKSDEIFKELGFSIERYSYVLIKDDLNDVEPAFSQELKLREFKLGRDEKDWCDVSNAGFKNIKGSTVKTPDMFEGMDEKDAKGMLLLYCNEIPVGHVQVSEEVEEEIKYAFISSLCVNPEFGGKGFGRNLLRAGLNYGKSMGITKGMLTVNAENNKALDLYLKEGFRIEESMICYNYNIK